MLRPDEVVPPAGDEQRRDEGTIGVRDGAQVSDVEPRRFTHASAYHPQHHLHYETWNGQALGRHVKNDQANNGENNRFPGVGKRKAEDRGGGGGAYWRESPLAEHEPMGQCRALINQIKR